jgi:hypothetical protein
MIDDAITAILARLNATSPDKGRFPNQAQRNQRIHELCASGMTQAEMGAIYGIFGSVCEPYRAGDADETIGDSYGRSI